MAQPLDLTRVLVVDDHAVFSEALELLLGRQPDVHLVGSARDADEAMGMLGDAPDVVLMDLDMPGIDGIEATRRIRAVVPDAKVVLLTAIQTPEVIADALAAGACGYVPKTRAVDELMDVVRRAAAGEIVMPERDLAAVLEQLRGPRAHGGRAGARPAHAARDRDPPCPGRRRDRDRDRRGARHQRAHGPEPRQEHPGQARGAFEDRGRHARVAARHGAERDGLMSTVLSPVPATKPGRRAAAPARPTAVTRVLVVEDHPLLRTVIKVACEQAASLEVVADMEDAESALEACRQVAPDVVVLDLSLAGQMQGLELARAIRAEGLPIRILVLTARTDDEAVFESVTIGVDGYLEKTAGVRMIAEALERVARGERVFTSAQMRGAISELGKRARYAREASGAKASLSERELEVLQRAALGLTVGQVARRLGISPRTVETHLTNAYRKLGARNRVQALSRASELGLVELA